MKRKSLTALRTRAGEYSGNVIRLGARFCVDGFLDDAGTNAPVPKAQ